MDVKKNPEKLSTIKVNEHIPSGFSMYTIPLLKRMENSLDLYRGKDCFKKYCKLFREHARKIINFKKKKVKLLANEQKRII